VALTLPTEYLRALPCPRDSYSFRRYTDQLVSFTGVNDLR